jgi:hypothetical protein
MGGSLRLRRPDQFAHGPDGRAAVTDDEVAVGGALLRSRGMGDSLPMAGGILSEGPGYVRAVARSRIERGREQLH